VCGFQYQPPDAKEYEPAAFVMLHDEERGWRASMDREMFLANGNQHRYG
jgi:hypothetical protein